MKTQSLLLSVAGLALLAACGGSSTSTLSNQFVLASSDSGFSGSGLPFASDDTGQVLSDLAEGDSFQIRVAGYENLEGETTLTPTLTTETVTLVESGFGGLVAEVTYRGETLQFPVVDGAIDADATLASGQEVSVFSPSGGTFSDVFEIFTYTYSHENPTEGAPNANGSFVLGFETDPAVVAELPGGATYTGIFEGFGGLFTRVVDEDTDDISEFIDNEISVDGSIAFDVSFAEMMVSADLEGSLDGADEPEFTGRLASTAIEGNSFAGDVSITCLNGFDCTSNSELGGAFYGPNADEAVGLIAFDVEGVDEDGTEIRIVSGAFFGAADIE